MTTQYKLERLPATEVLAAGLSGDGGMKGGDVIALDIQCKYQFFDDDGVLVHEYGIPGSKEIHNCSGYIDKLFKYLQGDILDYMKKEGVSIESLKKSHLKILSTRSPILDVVLIDLIDLLNIKEKRTISLFDLGCTVGEHYDMLDIMLQARHGESASSVLRYIGLDNTALVLSAAHILHSHIPPDRFQLIHAEGSGFVVPDDSFDLSLTVGVINHVADPLAALCKMLAATRYASVMAIWVTSDPTGFWVLNHSGVGTYFFSIDDLRAVEPLKPGGRFYVVDFVPETATSQPNSYIGMDEGRLSRLGCYSLVYSTLPATMLPYDPLAF